MYGTFQFHKIQTLFESQFKQKIPFEASRNLNADTISEGKEPLLFLRCDKGIAVSLKRPFF